MRTKAWAWVSCFVVFFLFLPSLLTKIGDFFLNTPWEYKSWLIYPFVALLIFMWVKIRLRKRRLRGEENKPEESLLYLVKRRLVKGEISLEEFREIRREIE